MKNRLGATLLFMACGLGATGCTADASISGSPGPVPVLPGSKDWESGYLPAADGEGNVKTFDRPFVLTYLRATVEPKHPKEYFVALGGKFENTWVSATNFSGPVFIPAGSSIKARKDHAEHGLVYSGFYVR